MALEHPDQNMHHERSAQDTTNDLDIVFVDPFRPPQLNGENISSGCNCPCARGLSEDDEDTVIIDSGQDIIMHDGPYAVNENKIDDSSSLLYQDDTAGAEGVEPHLQLEEGLFSPLPSPDEDYMPEYSMFVEPGSREISMQSSLATLPSRNSSVFALCGSWTDSIFISTPLRLTPEVPYYPRELVFS